MYCTRSFRELISVALSNETSNRIEYYANGFTFTEEEAAAVPVRSGLLVCGAF